MNCEACAYYEYDEELECYTCMCSLDEDEMMRFLTGKNFSCPYFRLQDEYGIARKQI